MDDEIERRRVVAEAEARLFGGTAAAVSVGRFEIRARLGMGGLGVVYAARDPVLDRAVAVKVLRADRSDGGDADRLRLMAEARAMARLAHPNVVAVHEVGVHEGRVFLAMELVEGETLRTRMRDGAAGLDVLVAAGRGLAAAHAAGLVHRDFKPENVLVGRDGRARVTDFGLAAPSGQAAKAAGTLAYVAPEQRAGAPATPAADQYAFCVVAWEALAGARPPDGDAAALPRHVEAALSRGLDARPEARWPSMEALLDALVTDPGAILRRRVTTALVVIVLALAFAGAVAQMWMLQDWMARAREAHPSAR